MQFFIVLVVASALVWLLPTSVGGRSRRAAMRRGLGIALLFTGVAHLVRPESFRVYFPDWVPFVEVILLASGLVEIVGGLALLANWRRAQVGFAIAAYFVAVFPANVYAALSAAEASLPGLIDAWWYPWLRLPFQAVFIWWAIYSTEEREPRGAERGSLAPGGIG